MKDLPPNIDHLCERYVGALSDLDHSTKAREALFRLRSFLRKALERGEKDAASAKAAINKWSDDTDALLVEHCPTNNPRSADYDEAMAAVANIKSQVLHMIDPNESAEASSPELTIPTTLLDSHEKKIVARLKLPHKAEVKVIEIIEDVKRGNRMGYDLKWLEKSDTRFRIRWSKLRIIFDTKTHPPQLVDVAYRKEAYDTSRN